MRKIPQLQHLGSLITYNDADGKGRCLGYLMHFEGHGVYDPDFGKVDVTPEQAEVHNKLLDEAMLKGLDASCEVGQGGSFYTQQRDGKTTIATFLGTLVSRNVVIRGNTLTFFRTGKVFRGRISTKHNLFNFRRVA